MSFFLEPSDMQRLTGSFQPTHYKMWVFLTQTFGIKEASKTQLHGKQLHSEGRYTQIYIGYKSYRS